MVWKAVRQLGPALVVGRRINLNQTLSDRLAPLIEANPKACSPRPTALDNPSLLTSLTLRTLTHAHISHTPDPLSRAHLLHP